MRPLAERQDDLAAALLNAALPIPDGLIGPDGEPSPTRFAVYRSNVVVSLIEALKDGFLLDHDPAKLLPYSNRLPPERSRNSGDRPSLHA